MKLRTALAQATRSRMAATPSLGTQNLLADASGLGHSTIQRVLARQSAATIDAVESIATAFGLESPAWLLLDDGEVALLRAWRAMGKAQRLQLFRSMRAP